MATFAWNGVKVLSKILFSMFKTFSINQRDIKLTTDKLKES